MSSDHVINICVLLHIDAIKLGILDKKVFRGDKVHYKQGHFLLHNTCFVLKILNIPLMHVHMISLYSV